MEINGYNVFKFVKKMKFLKKPLRKLLHSQGNNQKRVVDLCHELDEVHKALEKDPSSTTLHEEEVAYLTAFTQTTLDEESFFKQQAKIEWLLGQTQSGKVREDGELTYHYKCGKQKIVNICFVDDLIMFVRGDVHSARVLIEALDEFKGVSGLVPSIPKSTIFMCNFLKRVKESILQLMPFEHGTLPVKYLGNIKRGKAKIAWEDVCIPKNKDTLHWKVHDGTLSSFFVRHAWHSIRVRGTEVDWFKIVWLSYSIPRHVIHLLPIAKRNNAISIFGRLIVLLRMARMQQQSSWEWRKTTGAAVKDRGGYGAVETYFNSFQEEGYRIKDGLEDIVSINRSVFVQGRSISDNILVAQELMYNYHLNRGPPRYAFKIDIQKADDTVNWKFLEEILGAFGFHLNKVKERRLYQGDPMSPNLFMLAMEILTLILKRKVREDGELKYHYKCGKQKIVNICFVDDLIMFARGDVHSDRVLIEVLDEFKGVLGLVPSIPKSTIFMCNFLERVKEFILQLMPFKRGTLPVKYLGNRITIDQVRIKSVTKALKLQQAGTNGFMIIAPMVTGAINMITISFMDLILMCGDYAAASWLLSIAHKFHASRACKAWALRKCGKCVQCVGMIVVDVDM
uniref:Reverse transcriptase domain-containing protein n=1 Tax=Tanacetum cinerariifolium TaxID=118510 RepID=A0A6L2MGJ0_TANCI|nr:hypothetical protein [Tanacetum cinerariifolium]